MNTKEKNSRIEILRIVSILMIIVSHCCIHGLSGMNSNLIFNNIILSLFALGNLGVAIFVIITGYVSVDKKFKVSKIIRLELIILFYSLSLFILTSVILKKELISLELFKSFLPLTFKKYWFMTAYMLLYCLSPFINKFLNVLSKKETIVFILVIIAFVFLIPTITTADLYFNELFQFIGFYCVGGYIKKHMINNKRIDILIFITSLLMIVLLTSLLVILSNSHNFISNYKTYFLNRNSIFVLLLATSIFTIVIKSKPINSKVINIISSSVLGVYLIHDNPGVREIIWSHIIPIKHYINNPYLILIIIIASFFIFVSCVIVELFRARIFDGLILKISMSAESFIIKKYNTIYKRIVNKKRS